MKLSVEEIEVRTIFLEEARELLVDLERCLLEFEKSSHDVKSLDGLFRIAHNLKGSAAVVGFSEITAIAHKFESLLLAIKNGALKSSPQTIDLLLRTQDYFNQMLRDLAKDLTAVHQNEELHQALVNALLTENSVISSNVLDNSKNSGFNEIFVKKENPSNQIVDDNIRVRFSRIEKLLNNVGELAILHNVMLQQTIAHGSAVSPLLRETASSMTKIIKETQNITMGLRMLPLRPTFQKMERIVRDSSMHLGKEVKLLLQGEDTEIDKKVLEQITDPLIHIVRNAVDHGVETPSEREKQNKSRSAKLFLSAFHRAGHLVIEARDDGRGLDPDKLVAKAKEKGLLSNDAELTADEAYQLIFAPGFSTKEQVTDLSGRGVGMDVVKTNISALQGNIEIESRLNEGTCFRINLPLTMAIVDSIVVRLGNERFVIPLAQVSEFVSPREFDFCSVYGKAEILTLREENIPVFKMSTLLGKEEPLSAVSDRKALIVRNTKNQGAAVLVDQILSQQQVVIKPLGSELKMKAGLIGSAILGDGKPAIILDLLELLSKNVSTTKTNIQSTIGGAA